MIENHKFFKPKNWCCKNEDGNPKRAGVNKENRRRWRLKIKKELNKE
ncbi:MULTISPECIES: hypothetical protein [unclassified Spiroplasma]